MHSYYLIISFLAVESSEIFTQVHKGHVLLCWGGIFCGAKAIWSPIRWWGIILTLSSVPKVSHISTHAYIYSGHTIFQILCALQKLTHLEFVLRKSGFSGGSDSKKSAWNAGDPGSILGLRKSPGEGNGNPLQNSCLENSMDRRAQGATVHGAKELNTIEWLTPASTLCMVVYKCQS
jgi:hypothetical protein